MKPLRKLLDNLKPKFTKGGSLEKYFPIYDVFENLFYSSDKRTFGAVHIRDHVDLQKVMVVVWLSTFPAMFYGMYNLGLQTLTGFETLDVINKDDWHFIFIDLFCNYDPNSVFDCIWFGACYFIPIYLVTFLVGITWELIFAIVRGHEINEGAFVTTILFALCCPPDAPLWQVALGISFGIVVAKEIFGGTGKNFLNPALAGRAFLYFAYPASWSGDSVWVAIDGFSSPTILGIGAQQGQTGIETSYSWMDAFIGNIPGSIGETSTLFILLGLLLLLYTRVASWRIVVGVLIGAFLTSSLFNLIGSNSNPMFALPFYWHLVAGGFAFGLAFMAVEPVTGSHTNLGRWYYGFLIGIMVILIRVVNPAYPEGMMLAILFANLFAPLIDHFVQERNIKQRLNQPANEK
ncbi:MAG: NADH:ubiquinone reductase (Na(+)-transporting) subunit B [Gammaproteobacteria bacterium]|nr:NADH:ubiquinone reductase (Na(+)-transporting) subunit B [Gammaproteobacteria bacterium]|tara:strand:- start:967 stop:2181 length:1215 start_codon:yes stop_codon:yes gene_type:complete